MDVPLGTARFSLSSFNHSWCTATLQSSYVNATLQSYNATLLGGGSGMTFGALAFSVALMMLLGFTLLCSGFVQLFLGRHFLNLFLGRYNLYPFVRVLLRVTFVLFLPLLSTVFSLTKKDNNNGGTGLLLVLLWMLLIELIRKKVQAMVTPTDGSSFSRDIGRFTLMDYADDLAHVMWTGYLVYSNIRYVKGAPMKAMFAVLWSLSLVKLVQRAVNMYIAGRSFHTARNPLLIASYMQYVMDEQEKLQDHSTPAAATATPANSPPAHHETGSAVMETCKFVVTGDSKLALKKKKTKEGHQVQRSKLVTTRGPGTATESRPGHPHDHSEEKLVGLDMDLAKIDGLVTVEEVWGWGQDNHPNAKLFSPKRRHDLEDLCLSFSLFKLLRRRFEKYPMVEVGSAMARRLMLKGLLNLEDDKGTRAHRPFNVLQLELGFLENYYQAADHVVMSLPALFFLNFAFSMLFVPLYLVAVLAILISNGDAAFLYCKARGWTPQISPYLLSTIIFYLSITLALVATLICIEASEFFTSYFFSNWNTVRLACIYGKLPDDRRRRTRKFLYYLVAFRFLVSTVLRSLATFFLRHKAATSIKINQVSIIGACGPLDKLFSAWTHQVTLTTRAKEDIIKSLKDINEETGTVSLPLPALGMSRDHGRTKSVTEIILATHLATELFEMKHLKEEEGKKLEDDGRAVATTLSRYCMYLVAHLPFLLPDDETWVSERLCDMRNCLTQVLQQCGGGTMCTPSTSCREAMAESLRINGGDDLKDLTTKDAVKMLGSINSWDKLASFWVELLIYLAPSNDIQGHAKAVASSGGDLITYLWTFCTHAGITRDVQPANGDQDV
ncbi:hypothetical protein BAE44_0005842 [Dichanthelium oligosanthes]|uniref:DUF4220 domain-containing protein n=1 Tax=Dichanthelium oligosanthes TaxID=888268 RepID=A0A1E5W6R9_9POAL|nr:hypothetical protein BAE44_0005842 [Dichanthelium oligosanthes]